MLFQAVGERAREEEDDITVVRDGPEHVGQMREVGRSDSNAGRGLGPVKCVGGGVGEGGFCGDMSRKTGVEVWADGEIFCQGWVVVVEDFA